MNKIIILNKKIIKANKNYILQLFVITLFENYFTCFVEL